MMEEQNGCGFTFRLHKAYFIVVEVLLVVNYFEITPEVLGFAWIHLLSMHLLPSGEC